MRLAASSTTDRLIIRTRRSARRGAGGGIAVLQEILTREREQLPFCRVINGLPPDNVRCKRCAMFIDVVTKIALRFVGPGDEHLGDAGKRLADLSEKLMLGAHAAAVLARVMSVSLDLLGLNMVRVELQELRGVVVN
jgi:hypothetical protein